MTARKERGFREDLGFCFKIVYLLLRGSPRTERENEDDGERQNALIVMTSK